MSNVNTVVASAFLLLLLASLVYSLWVNPLSKVPGPWHARISKVWLMYRVRKGDVQIATLDLHKKYGPIVRIAPNEVSIWSASALKTVYGAAGRFPKGDWYRIVRRGGREEDGLNMLGEMNDEKRRMQRRLMGPTYSTTAVQKYEDKVDPVILDFAESLRTDRWKGQRADVLFHSFICDALGEVTISDRPGYIELGHDRDVIQQGEKLWRFVSIVGLSGIATYIANHIRPLVPLVSLSFMINMPASTHLVEWASPRIEKRTAEIEASKSLREDPRNDLAKDLAQLHHSRPEWTLKWTSNMLSATVGAGHDTSTTTFLTFFANVGTHAKVKARLVAELENAHLSDPPKYSEVAALPYFDACLKEAMRLYPVSWMPFVREVPPRGTTIDGHKLPGGTMVGANPYVSHRNPDIFGADAEEYNPDRWLKGSIEQRRDMERALLSWGGDSRTCPGQYLAQLVLLKAMAALLTQFDLDVKWDKEALSPGFFLGKLNGIDVDFRPK